MTSTCSGAPTASPPRPTATSALDPENVVEDPRAQRATGQMVPLGSLVTFREIAGPERVPRYNLFPSVEVNGSARAGDQLRSGARDHARRWRPTSCRRASPTSGPICPTRRPRSGRTGYYIFVLRVIFVFLALAAQYESWSLPLAIMLIVPMCLFSARRSASWLHGRDINILTQIGFVVLIGAGRQERHPDRRVRAPARGSGRGYASRPRSRPAGCGCGRS